MKVMADTAARDRILNAAEIRARTGGYHGFSFRNLAEDVGVKSSSVHYYFPTKGDLGEALAKRYTARAKEYLGDPAGLSPTVAIARLTQLFRDALLKDVKMCLCGLFGAERDALPPAVATATGDFFRLILGYLTAAFGADWTGEPPAAILARLEGALIVARTLEDVALFELGVPASRANG
jgi:TetR/AcrR family transcriptional repressor of nem operon